MQPNYVNRDSYGLAIDIYTFASAEAAHSSRRALGSCDTELHTEAAEWARIADALRPTVLDKGQAS